jgi:hypothetical protein
VPRRAKVVVVLAGLWLLAPIDLLPEFLPVIGPLDDVRWSLSPAVGGPAGASRCSRRRVAGEDRLLERLLGGPAPATG